VSARYTDSEIAQMIAELKPLPADYESRIQMREKRGHRERELLVTGNSGGEYRLILRQGIHNPLDFSIILGVSPSDTSQLFRLRRYNGRHQHTNLIERNTFYAFHIHHATERYQDRGTREDAYAEATDRYSDYATAQDCMIQDCGFVLPNGSQSSLFLR